MSIKMLERILDRRAMVIYLSTMILLILTRAGKDEIYIFGLLGGINTGKATGALNVFELLRWNVCVLPPVAVSNLFMMTELGPLSVYTAMRSKNSMAWFRSRSLCLYFANALYVLLFVAITFTFNRDIEQLSQLVLMFSLHTTMMSVLSVTLLILSRNMRIVYLLFFLIEGFGVVIGSRLPAAAKYLIAFWGMKNNNIYLFSNENRHLWITSSVMIIIIISCYIISVVHIKKCSPVENC